MEVLIILLGLIAALATIFKAPVFQLNGISKPLIILLFIFKLAGAIGLWQYYEKMGDRSNADIFKYFDDGLKLKASVDVNPSVFLKLMLFKKDTNPEFNSVIESLENWNANDFLLNGNSHRFMIRFNGLLAIFTGGVYFLHLLLFTFISYTGVIFTLKKLPIPDVLIKKILLFILTLSPTLLFWTSGILKESVVIFLLGLLIYHLKPDIKRSLKIRLIFIMATLAFIFALKPYVGFCVMIALTLLLAFKKMKYSMNKVAFSSLIIILLALIIIPMESNLSPYGTIKIKRESFVELANNNKAESLITIPIIESSLEVIYKGPKSIFNVIFRPHIFEINKSSYLPFALESLLILLILSSIIFYYKKPDKATLKFIYPSLFFILALTMIIGLSTPILGASVRYRAPAIFLIYMVLIMILDTDKIIKRISSNVEKLKRNP